MSPLARHWFPSVESDLASGDSGNTAARADRRLSVENTKFERDE